jgi:AcrR family transcriptional regulator
MAHMPVTERRTQLIEAAVRVIVREGVTRATTRRIAEEAGAPLASLHYSFQNKEELFAAVIAHGVEHTDRLVAERSPAPGSGLRGAVAEYITLFREWAAEDPDLMVSQYALLAWLLRTRDGRPEAEKVYRRYFEGLFPMLRSAATEQERDVNLDKLARLAVAAVDGMILQLITVGPAAVADVAPEDVADGLIHTARVGS